MERRIFFGHEKLPEEALLLSLFGTSEIGRSLHESDREFWWAFSTCFKRRRCSPSNELLEKANTLLNELIENRQRFAKILISEDAVQDSVGCQRLLSAWEESLLIIIRVASISGEEIGWIAEET